MPEPTKDRGWRQGRHQPQNLYADGRYVGVMFDPNHAWIVCEWMNQRPVPAVEAEDDVVDAEIDYSEAYNELAEMRLAVLAIHRPCHTADVQPWGCTLGSVDPETGLPEHKPTCGVCVASWAAEETEIYPCPTAQALGVTA
jgi:hypothetical protein